MTEINYSRRSLLLATTGCLLGQMTPLTSESYSNSVSDLAQAHYPDNMSWLFSANNDSQGYHYLSRVDLGTQKKLIQALPFRAHDILVLNPEQCIAFGRRPSIYCAHVDFTHSRYRLIKAALGRHFYGHGCLSEDQEVLFTTENDYANVRGVIGIRDRHTFRSLGEYDSYGVGPHDIQLLPDQKTLLVANGGIHTHPDFGRRKLNINNMQPSLVYMDASSGKKIAEYRLNDRLLSLRHLTLGTDGGVGVAAQYQGNRYQNLPTALLAWQEKSAELKPLVAPAATIKQCRGYIADLAYDQIQHLLVATSPHGNRLIVWDTQTGEYLYSITLPEVSGIQFQANQGHFIASTAHGGLWAIRADHEKVRAVTPMLFPGTLWDNHLSLYTLNAT